MPDSAHRGQLTPLRVAEVALGLTLIVGCAHATNTGPVIPAAPVESSAAGAAAPTVGQERGVLAASHPTRLRIPAIDVDTTVIDLGLGADGTMEVPADGKTAGWYTESPTPGERGPAVLAAHVDWNHEKGAFYDLRKLGAGDEVRVARADGSSAVFRVNLVKQYPKDHFPTDEVYGDVDGAELRLITCGGEFDRNARSYRDNIVVYAGLTGSA